MNSARGALKPLLRLMGKMRFANDFDAYGVLIQFVSRRALRRGGYRPLVLYGPQACGKTRMSTTIRKVLGITDPGRSMFWNGAASVRELDHVLMPHCMAVVLRDVSGNVQSFRDWLFYRQEERLATDLIIETSDFRTFSSLGRMEFCDSVVFDGLPTDAGKGVRV